MKDSRLEVGLLDDLEGAAFARTEWRSRDGLVGRPAQYSW
jgi:hypothetical protein